MKNIYNEYDMLNDDGRDLSSAIEEQITILFNVLMDEGYSSRNILSEIISVSVIKDSEIRLCKAFDIERRKK